MLTVRIPLLSQNASVFLVLGNVGPEALMGKVVESLRVSSCVVVLSDVHVKRGAEGEHHLVCSGLQAFI